MRAPRCVRICFSPKTTRRSPRCCAASSRAKAKYLQVDPYANAFTIDYRVWEQKFELDSLCLSDRPSLDVLEDDRRSVDLHGRRYRSGSITRSKRWSASKITRAIRNTRTRNCTTTPARRDPNPVGYTGMIWTGFRPSDDACKYNYLIPSEMMAVVALGDLDEIERIVYRNLIKSNRAQTLRAEVQDGIQKYGEVFTPNYGYVYAYEVDGLGHADAHGRREHPEPALGAVLRLHQSRQLRLQEHAPLSALQGRPVLLRRIGGARHRQRAHERRLRLAVGADRARFDRDGEMPNAKTFSINCSRAIPAITCCTSRSIPTIPAGSRARTSAGRTRSSASSCMTYVQRHRAVADGRYRATSNSVASRRPFKADIVLGVQWGDEGKGRVIDAFAAELRRRRAFRRRRQRRPHARRRRAKVGAAHRAQRRAAGPPGAVHRRRNGRQPRRALAGELDMLAGIGVDVARIKISDRAHVVFPYHAAARSRRARRARGTRRWDDGARHRPGLRR